MAATTKALGIKLPAAAVQALKAGADLALFAHGGPRAGCIDAVTAAIESGRIPRAEAEAKVQRVLELKLYGRSGAGGAVGRARRRPHPRGWPGRRGRPLLDSAPVRRLWQGSAGRAQGARRGSAELAGQ